jgi:multiple sugar transport system substrate-binding protein
MPVTLELSLIEEPSEVLRELLDEFSATHKVQIHLTIMHWENAWPELLTHALYGKGPDLSHIGSTWVSSLVAMNVLREFSTREVEEIGGTKIFTPPIWQSAQMLGDSRVWSIPWSAFTFLVLYRRDHLQALRSSGIDEQQAFETPAKMLETVQQLRANGFRSAIVLPSGEPFLDRVHIAASWVWGAGGNYISDDGKRTLLNQPETRNGLKSFYELYRYMSRSDHGMNYGATLEYFSRGDASIVIADCGFAGSLAEETPDLREKIGVHALPGVPFVSGDNLVIWQTTRQYPAREKAALELITFLTSQAAQTRFYKHWEQFPVRREALDALDTPIEQLAPVLRATFEGGRAHKPVQLWSRYETQLGHVLDEITKDVISKFVQPIDEVLENHLAPLQQRFALLMG